MFSKLGLFLPPGACCVKCYSLFIYFFGVDYLTWNQKQAKFLSGGAISPLHLIQTMVTFRSQKDMATYVIEVTEFNSEDICNLGGCLVAENGQNPTGTIITQIQEQKTEISTVAHRLRHQTIVQQVKSSIPASSIIIL